MVYAMIITDAKNTQRRAETAKECSSFAKGQHGGKLSMNMKVARSALVQCTQAWKTISK